MRLCVDNDRLYHRLYGVSTTIFPFGDSPLFFIFQRVPNRAPLLLSSPQYDTTRFVPFHSNPPSVMNFALSPPHHPSPPSIPRNLNIISSSPTSNYRPSKNYIYAANTTTIAIDQRTRTTGLPVRSAVLKPCAGRSVVGWVTTSEYRLLIVFFSVALLPLLLERRRLVLGGGGRRGNEEGSGR